MPGASIGLTALIFLCVVWNHRESVSILDIGVLYMAAFCCYSLIPIVAYLLSGMEYTAYSSTQFWLHPPNPEMYALVSLRYSVFIAAFACIHIVCRKTVEEKKYLSEPDMPVIGALLSLAAILAIAMFVIKILYGVDFDISYSDNLREMNERFTRLSLLTQQIVQNMYGMLFGMRFAFIIVCIAFWRIWWCRLLFGFWLLTLFGMYSMEMGARTGIILSYLGAVLLWHRYIRPFSISLLVMGGSVLLFSFFAMSILRGHEDLREGLGILSQWISESGWRAAFSFGTEFQNGFAGTYDLYRLKQTGMIETIPWQIHAVDFLVLIPSQLLPFDKIGPQQWYYEKTEAYGYFMLNPIGQAILGLDWVELIFRGAILGWCFAKLHNWYSRNSDRFLVVWAYLWLVAFSYYSIRSMTFSFLYIIIYQIAPSFLMIGFISHLYSKRSPDLVRRLISGARSTSLEYGSK
ncbi:MAG: hypothetical protein JXA82_16250 [Sedimentisphaerales bacterium]|nr:hypothetical protein [Sedimentisphaerales bacterium]